MQLAKLTMLIERFKFSFVAGCLIVLLAILFKHLLASEPTKFKCEIVPAKIISGVGYNARSASRFCNVEI